MNKISVLGIVLMSSILIGSGIYSNMVFAINDSILKTKNQQTGSAAAATGLGPSLAGVLQSSGITIIDGDQESKCKKDSECKNIMKVNNEVNNFQIQVIN